MRLLGIDPGLQVTGYGLISVSGHLLKLIEAGTLRSAASQPLEGRLAELYRAIDDVVGEFLPDAVIVEDLYAHYQHPKTAVIMGHARGVLYLAAGMRNIPVFAYTATHIKKAVTGTGHATKDQVARMVAQALRCDVTAIRADVTDALAAALCHLNALSHGSVV